MKKLFVIILLITLCGTTILAQDITLHRDGASVRDLMQQIQQEYGFSFSVASDVIDIDRIVPSVHIDGGTIEAALEVMFQGQDVSFSLNGKTIAVVKKTQHNQQNRKNPPLHFCPPNRPGKGGGRDR